MANTLANIMPKILARALMTLREQCVMPRLVNFDYANEGAMKGATIDVPIPTASTVSDVTPSNTPPAPSNTTPALVQVSLDKWRKADPFHLSDKDMVEIDKNRHFLPMQMSEAVRALANDINQSVHAKYKRIYGYYGTAGTTPFASDVLGATQTRKILNQQVCPRTTRRGVVNFDAEANMLALSPFSDAEKIMSAQVKMEGEIGRKYGIDWVSDDHVTTHTSTAFSAGAVTVNGAHSAAPTARTSTVSIAKATNTTPLVEGDILTFAGDSQTYVVRTAVTLAVGNTNVTVAPGLKVAKSGSEAVTLKASHVVNMVFHRDAFALAMRPLVTDTQAVELGSMILPMTDPVTGLTIRLEVSRQYKQVVWEFDALWGVELVREELATRLAG